MRRGVARDNGNLPEFQTDKNASGIIAAPSLTGFSHVRSFQRARCLGGYQPGAGPGLRPHLRVHQRLPRHCQRGGHRHLHQSDVPLPGGDALRCVQLPRRAARRCRRSLRHRSPAAGGAADQREHRPWPGDGLLPARRRHRLEPRHLVLRHPGLQLAHPDRLDPRRRPGQCADHRRAAGRRDQLAEGDRHRPVADLLAAGRLHGRRVGPARTEVVASAVEDAQDPGNPSRTRREEAPAVLEPPGAGAFRHGGKLRPWLQRRPEGYRPDHAGTDRHRPGQVRPRPEQHHLPDRAHPRRRPAPQSVLPAPHRYPRRHAGPGQEQWQRDAAVLPLRSETDRADHQRAAPRPARRAQLQRPGRRRARAGASLPAVPGRHREEGRQAVRPAGAGEGRPREATQGPDRDHRIRAVLGHHRGGPGSRHRHHGRLEARSAHRRREDRQAGHDLRPGHERADHRRRRHRHGQHLQPAGVHHPCTVLRRGRDHGGEQKRPARRHRAQHPDGLGAPMALSAGLFWLASQFI